MVTRITFYSDPPRFKRKPRRLAVGFVKSRLESLGWLWWIDIDNAWLSRHAAISQISYLRSKGWEIETLRHKGYKLIARPEDPPARRRPQQRRPSRPQFVKQRLLEEGHLWLDEVAEATIGRKQIQAQVGRLRRKGWEIETTGRGYVLHSWIADHPPAAARGEFVANSLRRSGVFKWVEATFAWVSRRVVYSQVFRLRGKGWRIETVPGQGYRLLAAPPPRPGAADPTQPPTQRGGRYFVKRYLAYYGHLWPEEVAGEDISHQQISKQVSWLRQKGWEIETTARGYVLHSRPPETGRAAPRPGFVRKYLQRRGCIWWTDAARAGVSRHVVVNQVQYLRRKGWQIDNTRRGYRLRSIPRPAPRGTPKSLTRLSEVKRRR